MNFDFDKLSERQLDVLGLIASNQDEGHPRKILDFFLARGLICECQEEVLGDMETHFFVPLHVHIAWCQWCSEHYQGEE